MRSAQASCLMGSYCGWFVGDPRCRTCTLFFHLPSFSFLSLVSQSLRPRVLHRKSRHLLARAFGSPWPAWQPTPGPPRMAAIAHFPFAWKRCQSDSLFQRTSALSSKDLRNSAIQILALASVLRLAVVPTGSVSRAPASCTLSQLAGCPCSRQLAQSLFRMTTEKVLEWANEGGA